MPRFFRPVHINRVETEDEKKRKASNITTALVHIHTPLNRMLQVGLCAGLFASAVFFLRVQKMCYIHVHKLKAWSTTILRYDVQTNTRAKTKKKTTPTKMRKH